MGFLRSLSLISSIKVPLKLPARELSRCLSFITFMLFFVSTFSLGAIIVYRSGQLLQGNPISVDNDFLTVDSPFGKVQISKNEVSCIIFDETLTSLDNPSELNLGGRKIEGYLMEMKSGTIRFRTWFGQVIVRDLKNVAYVGFVEKPLPQLSRQGPINIEITVANRFTVNLVSGEMYSGVSLKLVEDYIVLTDPSKNEFYFRNTAVEDVYIPSDQARGYDLVITKTGKKLYGIVNLLSNQLYQITGIWGTEVVPVDSVAFTTCKAKPDETSIDPLTSALQSLEYDKDGIATTGAKTPLTVDGKKIQTIKIYDKEITDPRTGIVFVYVPGGTFKMGADKSWGNVEDDEMPSREVYVSGFYISKYPITVKQYLDFLRAAQLPVGTSVSNGRFILPVSLDFLGQKINVSYTAQKGALNFPITGVNWKSANLFCNWAGYQLPTEAQWEKAARGRDGRRYPWGNTEVKRHNNGKLDYNVNEFENTDVSPYGVVNTYGFPIEFCRDYYDKDAYKRLPNENPFNASGTMVVGRVGTLSGRITDRIPISPDEERQDFTFRVVIPADKVNEIFQTPLKNKFIGATLFTVNDAIKREYKLRSEGLYVAFVEKGSPAESAGLKTGDVITTVDGKTVKTLDELSKILSNKRIRETLKLTVDRSGNRVNLTVRLGEWSF
ncbi:SUMF1/EgtB/PvdO family nonheme iron enzyme [Fervidobacterium thailandense]|uniref:PDZ domain-containing protein n=1 Tax=Fervidobacterium thailandense TaxID=1008305 RepID=A0A1E3G1T6_9BACT|nr:SUMF1/EgtB/PvdO family nonheme iron enzyme [Fervidobacterium thailandense]ODN30234.1 hypothetical protein A4H02_06650 [Fervidobacterium thailandense]